MHPSRLIFGACVIVASCLAGRASAATTEWIGPSFGDWFSASNWSNGVPTLADNAIVNAPAFSTPAEIWDHPGLTAEAWLLDVGPMVCQVRHVSGDALFVGMRLGFTGGEGHYALIGGACASMVQYIGGEGFGRVEQYGSTGTNTVGTLYLGHASGGEGWYLQEKGHLQATDMYVGYEGKGWARQEVASANVSNLYVGEKATATGTYDLQDAGTLTVSDVAIVGHEGRGTFLQSDGTHTVGVQLTVGAALGGHGRYELSGGTLDVPPRLRSR